MSDRKADPYRRRHIAEETPAETSPPPDAPPASGTAERSGNAALPPAGRVDAERATWGEWRNQAGNVPDGAPPENVGGAQGSQPDDSVADQPEPAVSERPGYREPRTGERRP